MWWVWTAAMAGSWETTIDEVVGSVVVLRYERPHSFDGQSAGTPQASGFIVDAERGIILTNRHVVGTGPQVARALFQNQEEIAIEPLYADPIHDFGFYRYNPADLKQNEPRTLELAPEGAQVGTDIRLIGNDAGEQLSILDGTLSRVDRSAPWWDFNTFYVQAASDSSGGSSGSPVFDVDGRVVALNAGGRRKESTSYYLRLERVKVALEALQQGEVPKRGSVMTEFLYKPFDELARLGLSDSSEAKAREAWDGTGMLVVERVAFGGVAQGKLKPGDIVMAVEGEPVFDFATLEGAFDDAIGTPISMSVERGGKSLTVELDVQDLWSMAPSEFLVFDEGSFHEVSYKDTIKANRPHGAILLASRSEAFASGGIHPGSVIESIDGTPVTTLDGLQETLLGLSIGQFVNVEYTKLGKPRQRFAQRIQMGESLIPNQRCARDPSFVWTCERIAHLTKRVTPEPVDVGGEPVHHKPARGVARRLVTVSSNTLFPLHTTSATDRASVGLVVDADKGLVLTDRWAVPSETSVVRLQAADSARIPAEIVYLDPLYNAAIIRYDPRLLRFGDLDPIEWSDTAPDEETTYFGAFIDRESRLPFSAERGFKRFDELSLASARDPKFRADNLMTFDFGKIDRPTLGGVVVDKKGRIVALTQGFSNEKKRHSPKFYLKTTETGPAQRAIAGEVPLYSGVDLARAAFTDAREAAVPDTVLQRVRQHRPHDPIVLEVWRVDPTVETGLRVGDHVVSVNGSVVASFYDFQSALTPSSKVEVIRNGEPQTVSLEPRSMEGRSATRAVRWAGAWVQEEHHQVARQSGTKPAGVYLSWYFGGSPAARYGLNFTRRLVAVNGTRVDSLDAFLAAVDGLADGESVRVGIQELSGQEVTRTLRLDTTWWPTLEVVREDGIWRAVD